MKIRFWFFGIIYLFVVGCVPQSQERRSTESSPSAFPQDDNNNFQAPEVNPVSTDNSVTSTTTHQASKDPGQQSVTTTIVPRTGKLELRINKHEVAYNGEFTVYIENKSNKAAEILKNDFNIKGFFTDKTYLTEPDVSIKAFGSCPATLIVGIACFVTIKNDNFLAPPSNSFATVKATIPVRYAGELNFIEEKSSQNTTVIWDNSIDLMGN